MTNAKPVQMRRVEITKQDNCVSYVMKRIGANVEYNSVQELIDSAEFEILRFSIDSLEVGDLLIWRSYIEERERPLVVTEGGSIIFRKRKEGGHVAVYEGYGLFSEVTYAGVYPIVQLLEVSEYYPDNIARLKLSFRAG